jgi:beta-carotene 3-hydroxylase
MRRASVPAKVAPSTQVAVAAAGFVAMEAVSYATHRWLMHGRGMPWHRSHHPPGTHGFEKNDLFPATFAGGAVAVFALAAVKPRLAPLRWFAAGVTGYGLCYATVHEVLVHHRLPISVPRRGYTRWLDDSHRIHHLFGGEPYGMLLPLVRPELRRRAAESTRSPWPERASTRPIRARL